MNSVVTSILYRSVLRSFDDAYFNQIMLSILMKNCPYCLAPEPVVENSAWKLPRFAYKLPQGHAMLERLPNLSEPQFPHLRTEVNTHSTRLWGLLGCFSERSRCEWLRRVSGTEPEAVTVIDPCIVLAHKCIFELLQYLHWFYRVYQAVLHLKASTQDTVCEISMCLIFTNMIYK